MDIEKAIEIAQNTTMTLEEIKKEIARLEEIKKAIEMCCTYVRCMASYFKTY